MADMTRARVRTRVEELLGLIEDTRNKKQRARYVAALRELLRPVLEDEC